MSEGWSIAKTAGQKFASRHWERKRCPLCQHMNEERAKSGGDSALCPKCAGAGP